jgi:hypothetical protein
MVDSLAAYCAATWRKFNFWGGVLKDQVFFNEAPDSA